MVAFVAVSALPVTFPVTFAVMLLGKPTVIVPEDSATSTSLEVPRNCISSPRLISVVLDPSLTPMLEEASFVIPIAALPLMSALTTLFGKIDKDVRVYQLVSLLHQGWGKGRANGQQEFHCDIPKELRKKLLDENIPIKLCIGTGAKGTRVRVLSEPVQELELYTDVNIV